MQRSRIKICGITRAEDAQLVVAAGVDAIGLVFYPPSPRAVTIEQAQQVIASLPPFVTVVALFVDETPERVRQVLAEVAVTAIQFHGTESADYCQQFQRPYIKALRVKDDMDLSSEISRYHSASGILLDAYKPGVPGGTGEAFNWSLVPKSCSCPIILAGGLDANNVATAIEQTRPYAVDVSGGVEAAKGIKDADKVVAFVAAADSVRMALR